MGISRYEKDLNEREEANQRFALGDEGYRLFKAAPELLEVMDEILKFQVKNDWMDLPIWVRAKNAVAKAKGQEVQELDEDGIPLPGPLPFPNDWPPQGGE